MLSEGGWGQGTVTAVRLADQPRGLGAFCRPCSPLRLKYPESCHRRSGKCPYAPMPAVASRDIKAFWGTERPRREAVTSQGETL